MLLFPSAFGFVIVAINKIFFPRPVTISSSLYHVLLLLEIVDIRRFLWLILSIFFGNFLITSWYTWIMMSYVVFSIIYYPFWHYFWCILHNISLSVCCYCCRHIYIYYINLGIILQWPIAPSMGRRWTRSRDAAGGLMERSGGAPKTRTRTLSTVSATCTVAATVQESLWNHKPWHSHHRPLWHPWLSAEAAAAGMGASRAFRWVPLVIPKVPVLEPTNPSIIWTPFHMESQTKITGITFSAIYFATFGCLENVGK